MKVPHKDEGLQKKESFKKSFCRATSYANANGSGVLHRPTYNRLVSGDNIGMTEKLHKMMENYIPSDNDTIEKRYIST